MVTPGENVEDTYYFNSYKLTGDKVSPGADDWTCYIGAGKFNGTRYFIAVIQEMVVKNI